MTKPENRIDDVLEQLAILDPTAGETPRPAKTALAELKAHIAPHSSHPFIEFLRSLTMTQNRKIATTIATLVVMFGIAFSFPTVRAAANDFLGLFRVQKFSAISISPERIAVLEQLAETGLTPGEFEIINEPGAAQRVNSVREAARLTGLEVRTLPTLDQPQSIHVLEGGDGRLIIDAEQAQEILRVAGADPRLIPDSVDGAHVEVNIFAMVEQQWSDGTLLMQTESPIVAYPDALDPVSLGEALLQIVGMDPGEARRLAQNIDWTSTVLLPIPQDVATFEEVIVNGVSGLGLNSLDGRSSALLWQQEGVVFVLVGTGNTADLVDLAQTLD